VKLFAVSVDPPEASRRLKQRLKSRFTFLADPEGVLLDGLGIRHRGGRNDGADIAYPTAVLVDAEGVVRWIFHADNLRERARAEEIFAAIAELYRSGAHRYTIGSRSEAKGARRSGPASFPSVVAGGGGATEGKDAGPRRAKLQPTP
jgi:hypothetical protein